METDKPFGYGQEQSVSWTFSDSNVSKILSDISDEIGYTYPTVIITIKRNGDLSLYNELENCTTVIKNCKVGEVITLNGDTQIITTTYAGHDICNDFNYEFLGLEIQSIIEIIVFQFLYLVMWSLSILPLLKIRHNYL